MVTVCMQPVATWPAQLASQPVELERTQEQPPLSPGDSCVALTVVLVRREESILSDVVTTLPAGFGFEILELGASDTRRRARVSAGLLRGWITTVTSAGQSLVRRRGAGEVMRVEDLVANSTYEAKTMIAVRAGEDLCTEWLTELSPGTFVRILEMGRAGRRRARVRADSVEGWISLGTSRGQVFVGEPAGPGRGAPGPPAAGRAEPRPRNRSGSFFISGPSRVKSILEFARDGDLAALRDLVGGGPGGLDCGDVRGRTPLMYAVNFGNKHIVEFLLQTGTVHVNELDDTNKTALHHASTNTKRPNCGEAVQSEIIGLLTRARAMVEARDHNGCTALMLAAARGNRVVVEALLDAEASAHVKDYEGNTPLDYAVNFGHGELVQFLGGGSAPSLASGEPVSVKVTSPNALIPPAHGRRKKGTMLWVAGVDEGKDIMGVVIAADTKHPGMSDSEFEKEQALHRLLAVTAEATEPRELEASIQVAERAGVAGDELERASLHAEALKARARAHDRLLAAMDEREPRGLGAAIAEAEGAGVPRSAIDEAQSVFAEEEPRQQARDQLKEAQNRGDVASLRVALDNARRLNLAPAEVAPVEELLRCGEQAEEGLRRAVETRNVAALRLAIPLAREAGLGAPEVQRAQDILHFEEPRQEARERLSSFREGADTGDMRRALLRAHGLGLGESEEYRGATQLLEREEARQSALALVQRSLDEAKKVDHSCIESLRRASADLTAVVQGAKEAGVCEASLRQAEGQRRRLHNMVEDLKGATRVFCRIRPMSQRELASGDTQATHADGMTLAVEGAKDPAPYAFDAVFAPGTQEEVFEDCKDLVQSALDGYNVTVFAYGQTGAGKTFTMYGCPGMEGTAPRVIQELYRLIERDQERVNYTVMASMMELYRNELLDLLVAKPAARKLMSDEGPKKLNVRADKTGLVQIEHLTEEECSTAEALSSLLERGNGQRTVAATAMNSESSRSHLLLTIKIVGVNRQTHDQLQSKFMLCDLAGSERLKKSEVSGDMMKESIEINKSLTALGDVIEALTKGQKHIPYKNHKLTQVMQDAVGGTSKTLMFVNCSPASANVDETIMSLKYATRAKKIVNDQQKLRCSSAK